MLSTPTSMGSGGTQLSLQLYALACLFTYLLFLITAIVQGKRPTPPPPTTLR